MRLGTVLRTLGHTPGGGGATAPGSPSISLNSVTHNSVVFNHTPPSDADYDYTIVIVHSKASTSVYTGTGSGSTITVSGLPPSTAFWAIAVAVNTSGMYSYPSGLDVVLDFSTNATATPTYPLYIKWGFDHDLSTLHEYAPVMVDASVVGMRTLHNIGNGRVMWFMTECDAPTDALEIQAFGFRIHVRDRDRMGGVHNDHGMGG